MNHRNEIDGLRAIAVLPVIFFHAEFPGFSGGFVGVDVFFVISGFLITRIILDELLSGNFSLLSFYERRARRILPALFVVMATTFAISWFVLLPFDFKALAKSAWAVVFFLSNFFFWLDSGYWSTDAQLLPLLHTWSLAIEEQFYLFFPLLLMLLVKLAHRDNRHIKLAAFGLLLTSLLTAEWMSRTNPDAAFFLLPFRGWELLLGALVAVYHFDANKATLTSRQNEAGSLLGLALIVFSVATYDRTTPFPGLYALAPTLGAALIILCARQGTLVGRLLSTPIFVGIGLISYSAYLWHHPLFALARHNSLEDLSAPTYLGLCAATLLLAYLSWRFVEQPFRQKTLFKRRAIFGFTGLATIGFVAIASIVYKNKGFEDRIPGFEQVAAQFPWQRSNIACSSIDLSLAHGVNALCSQDQPLNDADPAPVDIALYGDSHADAMLPAIVAMTKNDQSSHIYLGLGGCVPLLGVDIRAGVWPERVCRDLGDLQYETAKKHRVRNVMLVARWGMYIGNDPPRNSARRYYLVESDNDPLNMEHTRQVFRRALSETIHRYADIGAKVFLVEQVPQQRYEPSKVFHQLNRSGFMDNAETTERVLSNHSVTIAEHNAHQKDVRALVSPITHPNFSVLRLDELLCATGKCLLGDKDGPYYFDKDHIGVRGAELASTWLAARTIAVRTTSAAEVSATELAGTKLVSSTAGSAALR